MKAILNAFSTAQDPHASVIALFMPGGATFMMLVSSSSSQPFGGYLGFNTQYDSTELPHGIPDKAAGKLTSGN